MPTRAAKAYSKMERLTERTSPVETLAVAPLTLIELRLPAAHVVGCRVPEQDARCPAPSQHAVFDLLFSDVLHLPPQHHRQLALVIAALAFHAQCRQRCRVRRIRIGERRGGLQKDGWDLREVESGFLGVRAVVQADAPYAAATQLGGGERGEDFVDGVCLVRGRAGRENGRARVDGYLHWLLLVERKPYVKVTIDRLADCNGLGRRRRVETDEACSKP